MHKAIGLGISAFLVTLVLACTASPLQAQAKPNPYPAMAPLNQYLIPDRASEIALARTAAPPSISNAAEIMVLTPSGYTTAAQGSNGFVCIVERAWGNSTDDPQFWNPRMRAPHCFNAPAARTFLQVYLMKTKLVLAGKSTTQIAQAVASAFEKNSLPPLEPNAMCYMMSRQQYLNDDDKDWHPHMMWFVPGDAAASWGANLPGSPSLAANDPEERVTIFLVTVDHWSDGTPAPHSAH